MGAPLTGDPEVSRTEPEITNRHPTPPWMGRGPAAAVTFGGPFTTWKSRTQTANAGNIVTQEESPGQSGVDGESGDYAAAIEAIRRDKPVIALRERTVRSFLPRRFALIL